jgi:hypothetical protein
MSKSIMVRGWINAPSTHDQYHRFSGTNVLYNPNDTDDNGRTTVYPLTGNIHSLVVRASAIAKGERK